MLVLSSLVLLVQGLWCLGALEDEDLLRPPIRPILPPNSSLIESPSGDFFAHVLNPRRDAFFLLYAPWDLESREGGKILKRLRSIFPSDDITLGAINCWNHKGACYQRYFGEGVPASKRYLAYPQWIYVPHKNRSLKDPYKNARFYNSDSGRTSYENILAFIMRQKYPIRVWKTYEEWLRDRVRFGGLALTGYFTSRPQIREYVRSAEMLALLDSKDKILPVGVVLNKSLAERLDVKKVKLFWWSGSIEFPPKMSFNKTTLVAWTKKTLVDKSHGHKYLVPELQTSSTKSFLLDNWLVAGSSISVLGFLNPGMGGSYFKKLSIMRESALLYLTSKSDFEKNKNGVKELYESMILMRKGEDQQLFKDEAICKSTFFSELRKINHCSHSMYYNDSRGLNLDVFSGNVFGDEFSVRETIKSNKKSFCLRLAYSELDSGCIGQHRKDSNRLIDESMKGELLGIYSGNKSVNFYFLNSASNRHLMQLMGLNPEENQVLIDDMSSENRWKMESSLTAENLAQFIWDFHYRQDTLKKFKKIKMNLETCDDSKDLCIQEISASNFEDVVLNSVGTHVVVLYQTVSCYFCAAARRSLHELKRFFEPVDFEDSLSRITFVTIDGSLNDLPMEHTAPVYPCLVFYPAGDKSKSSVYPLGEAFMSENIKKFVMGNMTPDEVLRVEAHWCGEDCIKTKKSQLDNAIRQIPEPIQKEFLTEFEEIKRLLLVINDLKLSTSINNYSKTKYEFIRDFRTFMDGLRSS